MLPAGFAPPLVAVIDTEDHDTEVWVGGQQATKLRDTSGVRGKWLAKNVRVGHEKYDVLVKTEWQGGSQSQAEWDLWWSLAEEDRPFFTPVIAGGVSSKGESAWVASPYLDFPGTFRHGGHHDPDAQVFPLPERVSRQANKLRAKYGIGDWSDRQYKPAPSNWPVEFVIHDYGFDDSYGEAKANRSRHENLDVNRSDPKAVIQSYIAQVEQRYGVQVFGELAPRFVDVERPAPPADRKTVTFNIHHGRPPTPKLTRKPIGLNTADRIMKDAIKGDLFRAPVRLKDPVPVFRKPGPKVGDRRLVVTGLKALIDAPLDPLAAPRAPEQEEWNGQEWVRVG